MPSGINDQSSFLIIVMPGLNSNGTMTFENDYVSKWTELLPCDWLNRLFFLSAGVPKEVSGECVSIPDTVLTEGPSLIKLGSFWIVNCAELL